MSYPRPSRCVIEPVERRILLANVPPGFTDTQFASGINSPTSMTIAPDGRLFVTEQTGAVRIVRNDNLLTQPFATLPVTSFNDRGLLSVTLDPNFQSNGYVYVYYTAAQPQPHNRVSRLRATGDVSDGTETVLLNLPNIPGSGVHMGGALHFGGDGKLYLSVGEHSGGIKAQHLDNPFGKMLRMNPDGSVPSDNPFLSQASGVNRYIWARGLRNPFTFAVQPGTGRIFINDVGSDLFEEINEGIAGANYGWNTSEGPTNIPGETGPFYWYDLSQGCSIAGGTFYNPPTNQFPTSYVGKYLFSDYCGGWIRVLDTQTKQVTTFATNIRSPIDLDVGPDGSLYYLSRGADSGGVNQIGRIRFTATQAPHISAHPRSRTVGIGQNVTFSVTATGAPPLSYQWQRDGQDIAGATGTEYTIDATASRDNGSRFRVVVSNRSGSFASTEATLTVLENKPPVAQITSPTAGTVFHAGQTIPFSGSATDPEDGTIPRSGLTWEVVLHHADHTHPYILPFSGQSSGSFTIPVDNETDHNIFYRIRLNATDSAGLSHTVTRDIHPIKSDVTIDTNLPGSTFRLDGRLLALPYSFTGVAGIERQLEIHPRQTIDDRVWEFVGWSSSGQRQHTIATPMEDDTYTAIFRRASESKGLKAVYHNNRNWTGTTVGRIDGRVAFDWTGTSPDPLIHHETYAVRWTGYVQPLHSERYTFHVATDGGVRLLVDGNVIINEPDADGGDFAGSIDLVAGRKHAIRMEYNHGFGDAKIRLRWSSDSTPLEIIPRSHLYPAKTIEQALAPTGAAYVRGGASGSNFGDSSRLMVGDEHESYLKFDLSEVDVIGSARLRIYGSVEGVGGFNTPIAAHHAPGARWDEQTITWDSRPDRFRGPVAMVTVANQRGQWYELDVSRLIRGEKANGRQIVSFRLSELGEAGALVSLNSPRADSRSPQLLITA